MTAGMTKMPQLPVLNLDSLPMVSRLSRKYSSCLFLYYSKFDSIICLDFANDIGMLVFSYMCQ